MSLPGGTTRREKWLLVQLARFGDLMQTAPLAAAAGLLDPPPELYLLVDRGLEELAACIGGIDRVWSVGRDGWLAALDDPQRGWSERARLIKPLADELKDARFDRVVNLTHTLPSAYLTALTGAAQQCGAVGGRSGVRLDGAWERYFHVALKHRDASAFNLVDVHLGVAGLPQPRSADRVIPPPELEARYREMLKTDDGSSPLIALQLGANSPLRCWGVERFAQVAELIAVETGARFLLVGTKGEAELAERFRKGARVDSMSLIGRTSLLELAAALGCCDLSLGGDTGALHLAAALGVPGVTVFLAMARPDDTAPYGEGNVVFEPLRDCYPCSENGLCPNPACRGDVPPEAVAEAATRLLTGSGGDLPNGKSFRARRTSFDSDGFLDLEGDKSEDDSRRSLLRAMWKRELSGMSTGYPFFNYQATLNRKEAEELQHLTVCSNIIRDILSTSTSSHQMLRDTQERLNSADAEIQRISRSSGAAAMLADMHQLELARARSDNGNSLPGLQTVYGSLSRRAKFLLDGLSAQPEAAGRGVALSEWASI